MNSAAVNPDNRALSSIFIANIPQDVGDELLRGLFSEIGSLLNFRVILDKSSNKSKVAFCEYKDPDTALRAVHSLNGYEFKGQPVLVDLATSEKCRQELERLQGSIEGSLDAVDSSDKAPEEISKAVASLPAEQMFELMKQMKMCIENNPQEARNLLLQNPQLAYALLQAQVIMRIVDPNVAVKILNRPTAPPVNPEVKSEPVPDSSDVSEVPPTFATGATPITSDSMAVNVPASVSHTGLGPGSTSISSGNPGPVPPVRQPGISMMPGSQNVSGLSSQFADQDLRTLGPVGVVGDQDLRTLPGLGAPDRDMRPPKAMLGIDKDMRQPMGDQDLRTLGLPPTTVPESRPFDPRFRNMPMGDRNVIPGLERPRADPRTAYDPRNPGARVEDPRKASMAAPSLNSRLTAAGLGPNPSMGPAGMIPPDEQEKAALIMQVLQLTEQQIAALPPEQRQSIMVLKEQLARTQMI